MSDLVEREIVAPMRRLFQAPRLMSPEQESGVSREYVAALEQFDETTLKAAWALVRAEHLKGTWPAIAAIVAQCRRVTIANRRHGTSERAEEDRIFARFCELRGIDPGLMRRPNLWWMMPRDEWTPHWRESEVPFGNRPNMRNRDGSAAEDLRLA